VEEERDELLQARGSSLPRNASAFVMQAVDAGLSML
jgi:hypothetical protein